MYKLYISSSFFTDSLGRVSGFSGGTILEGIPGVQVIVPLNVTLDGDNENTWKQIYLPQKQDGLTIKVSGKTGESYDLMVAGGDHYTKVAGVTTSAGQVDRYTIVREKVDIDFDDAKTGTYALLVDNFQDTLTGTVYMDNIKTSTGTEQYTISWTGVILGISSAVQYSADYNTDGIDDITLGLPATYQDVTAPTTTYALSGELLSGTTSTYIDSLVLTLTYDANSNITSKGIESYTYDSYNQLTDAMYGNTRFGTGIQGNTYEYDLMGNRINEQNIRIITKTNKKTGTTTEIQRNKIWNYTTNDLNQYTDVLGQSGTVVVNYEQGTNNNTGTTNTGTTNTGTTIPTTNTGNTTNTGITTSTGNTNTGTIVTDSGTTNNTGTTSTGEILASTGSTNTGSTNTGVITDSGTTTSTGTTDSGVLIPLTGGIQGGSGSETNTGITTSTGETTTTNTGSTSSGTVSSMVISTTETATTFIASEVIPLNTGSTNTGTGTINTGTTNINTGTTNTGATSNAGSTNTGVTTDSGMLIDTGSLDPVDTGSLQGRLLYDKNGNLIGNTINNKRQFEYTYDAQNRLINVSRYNEVNQKEVLISFSYDALGRRTSKRVVNVLYEYVYSGNDVIEETQSNINATTGAKTKKETREYTYGARGTDDVVSVRFSIYIRQNKQDILSTTGNYYYEKNHLGSVIRITSSTGGIIDEYSYTVFGKAYRKNLNGLYKPVAGTNDSAIGNTRLYTGREYDKEISLYYLRARYYDANLGRFVSRDPIGMSDNVNLYTYVGNNSIKYTDRYGLEKTLIIGFGGYQGFFTPTGEVPIEKWGDFGLGNALNTLQSSSKNSYNIKFYYSSIGESELDTALNYIKEQQGKYSKLVVMGHSMGADDAVELSQMLNKEEISVDLLATIDLQSIGVDSTSVPNNVRKAVNYQQSHIFSSSNGDALSGDENNVTNYLVNNLKGVELYHTNIDDALALQILKVTSY